MSAVIVQKYGGSVLSDDASVRRAARAIAEAAQDGDAVVAVVSALASVTDRHLERARTFGQGGGGKVDLLLATGELESAAVVALALEAIGIPAEALNPWQIGLRTDDAPGDARIIRVNPLPIATRLAAGRVLVVPGFLGRTEDDRITTLGRGGSDLTAIALADAVGAERCEFVKDVPGYFSADPDLLPDAIHRSEITIEEALELSRHGCRFLQDRAIQWAARTRCRILLRALDDGRSTAIVASRAGPPQVVAITHAPSGGGIGAPSSRSSLISVVGDPEAIQAPELVSALLGALAAAAVPASVSSHAGRRLTIAVPADRLAQAHAIVHETSFPVPTTSGRTA